jgi:hypothetical protein
VSATRAALISRLRRFDFSVLLVPFRWRRHKSSTQISIKQIPIDADRRGQLPPGAFAFPLFHQIPIARFTLRPAGAA